MDSLKKASLLIEEIYFSQISKVRRNKTTKEEEVIYKKIENKVLESELKDILEKLYLDGYGYKSIVKKINSEKLSYTKLRRIIKDLGIEQRKGYNIITDRLKEVRAENATRIGTFKNWTVLKPDLLKNSKRFVGGYYFNKSKQKYVYLRSSWEYAYAKYLDSNSIDWDVEVEQYDLEHGVKYLPDFFIYENNLIKKIVEIKSLYNFEADERIKKYYAFRKLYPHITTELYTDIKDILCLLKGYSYRKIIKEWKNIKKDKNDVDRI